jgi:hypothetical protein
MLDAFRHVVVADFEFEFGGHASFEDASRSGERPRPVCLVAKELRSGQVWRIWRDEFRPKPPFPIGPDSLFIAYYASAELSCFRTLSWPKPANILDLFVEFRDRTNGLATPAGAGLIGALTYFGLDTIGTTEKDEMRATILRGGPWSERESILDYCATDIEALERLLPAMLPQIDLPRALLRGRYMAAAAAMEFTGTPIDMTMLSLLREHWDRIKDDLICAIDADFGVFEDRSFRRRALHHRCRQSLGQAIGERAGFPFTCGYALANEGHDTRAIRDWLGHRAIQHTARYRQRPPGGIGDVMPPIGAKLSLTPP